LGGSMKILIGVMSCESDAANGCHDALRRTWIPHMVAGIDCKIFVGQGNRALTPDEERLDIPDDYAHLPEKSQAMRKWALEHDYDFMFKADRDTYLSPRRLCDSGFERYDYSGHFPMHPQEGYLPADGKNFSDYIDGRGVYPYCSGGCGYWTSKRAMEAVVAAPLDWKRLDNKGNPAEDLWIPNILFPLGIRGYHDPRYLFKGDRLQLYGYNGITVHLSTGTGSYHPAWMDRCHDLSRGAL
jgi:hypothetical protein